MGLVHIYHGDGKGKTTAAVGLAVRAIGAGHHVLFQQFLKDGKSSELEVLRDIGITVDSGRPLGAEGFTWEMSEAQLTLLRESQDARLSRARTYLERHSSSGVIILDESIASINYNLLNKSLLLDFMNEIRTLEDGPDLVLTGREPAMELLDLADYISEVKANRHPFDHGVMGRKGIEY